MLEPIYGSTAPFLDAPEQGLQLACDNGHRSRWYLRGVTLEMALDYAAMLDGTHPMFVYSPREDPGSPWGHCSVPRCGALFRAEPSS